MRIIFRVMSSVRMFAVVDVETTGTDAAVHGVVEYAVVQVLPDPWRLGKFFTTVVDPGHAIPPEARAVHHISDEELEGAPSLTWAMLVASERLPESSTYVAHNAAFDSAFLGVPIPICTWRCARRIWPEAPAYGNQVLRYWLPGLHAQCGPITAPHRALPDAIVTANILIAMLAHHNPEQLVQFTNEPLLLKKVTFGKHKGMAWQDVPKDYMRWLNNQKDIDVDLKWTLEHYLT